MAEPKTVTISTTWLLTVLGAITAGAVVFFFNHTQAEGHEGVRLNRQSLLTNQTAIKSNQVVIKALGEQMVETKTRVEILEGK